MRQVLLPFKRFGAQIENDYGQLVPDLDDVEDLEVWGALQPYSQGGKTVPLPEGYFPSDARIFYTKELLRMANSKDSTPPDETEFDGYTWVVLDNGDWTTNLSRLAHYRSVLVRREAT